MYHRTVMLSEVLDFLKVKPGDWYLDATIGDGGHALGILKVGGRVIGIDQDPEALARTIKRLEFEGFKKNIDFKLSLGNFRDFDRLIEEDILFSGGVLDLGVSTLQLKTAERGFSFALDGDLDMRMSPSLGVRAADLINILSKKELYELFKDYGEARLAYRIAEAVALARPITKTTELTKIIEKVAGIKKPDSIHPATQVFQALRIAVNDELGALAEVLPKLLIRLKSNSRLVIISFHSLEERIVKNSFKDLAQIGLGKILTKNPIEVSAMEVNINPRSRSAKLRCIEKYA